MRNEQDGFDERWRDSVAMRSQPAIGDRCVNQLLKLGLIEKVGLPVGQVQALRVRHQMFGPADGRDSGVSEVQDTPVGAATMLRGAKCHRPCRRLTRAAYCRACHADIELARDVREVLAEHPGIGAEQLAGMILDRARRKRLTARVRRAMQEAVA